jgi:hypothetical protein
LFILTSIGAVLTQMLPDWLWGPSSLSLIFIYLFIYGLFNDAVSNLDYTVLNDRTISKKWIGKNGHGLI